MTDDRDYTDRLVTAGGARWKRVLNVQAPYRWNLRRLEPGRVLDVGCGIGRNLEHLDGDGIGVDTNPTSIEEARRRGFEAYTVDELTNGALEGEEFDSLLFAHVLEHMTRAEASALLGAYLPYLRPGGAVIAIVPQEAGFASDATHVDFLDAEDVITLFEWNGIALDRSFSFPFPRATGRWFRYNETIVTGIGPSRPDPESPTRYPEGSE